MEFAFRLGQLVRLKQERSSGAAMTVLTRIVEEWAHQKKVRSYSMRRTGDAGVSYFYEHELEAVNG